MNEDSKAWKGEHFGGLWNIALSEKDIARLASGVHPCLVQPEHLTAYWEYENMDKVEKVWQDFWKPIVAPDGEVDLEQVKKELYDFYMMLEEVPRVYDAATGGTISKPLTKADVVIAEFEYHTQKLTYEAIKDALKAWEVKSMEVIEAAQYKRKIEQAIEALLEEFEQESGLVVESLTRVRKWTYISPEEGIGTRVSVAITIGLPLL